MSDTPIPRSVFGRTGREVTRVGLGGEGILRTEGRVDEARAVLWEALSLGIGYFDSARVYRESEVYLGSLWGTEPELRRGVFQASKSASRDREGALRNLDETLHRLGTDHLDLWQIHDVRSMEELRQIESKEGALGAFLEAKREGRVRHIGVTGHHDPSVLTRAVREWPLDAVMMPVNPVEEIIGGFLTETLPAAREKNIAVIGMKILGASHYLLPRFGVKPEDLIRFALSKDITVAIVGCSRPEEVRVLAEAGRTPSLPEEGRKRLLDIFRPFARRLAFYRGVI